MKLGIIFTGGTIGCQVAEDGYLQLPDSSTYFLLEGAKERGILDGITVLPSEPFRLFSEQMTGETLSLLVNHVRERIWKEACDGWILLHGSDTLAYTAAVLGYVLGTDCPPLVLVASNEPLSNPKANGWTTSPMQCDFCRNSRQRVFLSAIAIQTTFRPYTKPFNCCSSCPAAETCIVFEMLSMEHMTSWGSFIRIEPFLAVHQCCRFQSR